LKSRSSLGILFLIVFTDLLGFGIVIPLLPRYGEVYAASIEAWRTTVASWPGMAHVTSSPAIFLGLCLGILLSCYSLFQFIFSPVWGKLSDRFGRKPILIVSLLGSAAGYTLFAGAHSIVMLILARSLAGIMAANISTAQAYIADVTTPENRAKGMGVVGAAFGLGFSLGPFAGGLLASLHGSAFMEHACRAIPLMSNVFDNVQGFPGLFAAGLSLTALVLTILFLPESLPAAADRTRVRPPRFKLIWNALRSPQVGIVYILFFIYTFGFTQMEVTLAQLIGNRFGLDIRQSYWMFAWVGLLGAIVQGGLIGRLSKRFGERALSSTGILFVTVALAAMSFVPGVGWLMGMLALLALGAGIANPSLSALVSRLTPPTEQGSAFGVFQSISSIARIIGPVVAQLLYQRGLHMHAPYLVATAAGAIGFLLSLWLFARPVAPPALETRAVPHPGEAAHPSESSS
jgi:DHA1 family tetracycline resistance protein-like MFS transporter